MNYLLDTNALIWYCEDSLKLSSQIKEIIKSQNHSIYVCSVSLWEITIKTSLNKLKIDLSIDELFSAIKTWDVTLLNIDSSHLNVLAGLPYIHKDPFDRLIVSSAIAEDLTIISSDENIHKYDVPCVWE